LGQGALGLRCSACSAPYCKAGSSPGRSFWVIPDWCAHNQPRDHRKAEGPTWPAPLRAARLAVLCPAVCGLLRSTRRPLSLSLCAPARVVVVVVVVALLFSCKQILPSSSTPGRPTIQPVSPTLHWPTDGNTTIVPTARQRKSQRLGLSGFCILQRCWPCGPVANLSQIPSPEKGNGFPKAASWSLKCRMRERSPVARSVSDIVCKRHIGLVVFPIVQNSFSSFSHRYPFPGPR
jgi:hypothetical protein